MLFVRSASVTILLNLLFSGGHAQVRRGTKHRGLQGTPQAGCITSLPTSPVHIVSQHSGLSLMAKDDNDVVQTYASSRGEDNWVFESDGTSSGLYRIVIEGTNRAMTVADGAPQNGVLVQVSTGTFTDARDKWCLLEPSEGLYQLRNAKTDKVVDVAGFSLGANSKIHQWINVGGTNQKWSLSTEVGTAFIPDWDCEEFATDSSYHILAAHSGMAVAVNGDQVESNVFQSPATASLSDNWSLYPTDGNFYQLIAQNSGLAMATTGNQDGANIVQTTPSDNSLADDWCFIPKGNGNYEIRNRQSSKSLDIAESSAADGGNVHQWNHWGGSNQQFMVEAAGSTVPTPPAPTTPAPVMPPPVPAPVLPPVPAPTTAPVPSPVATTPSPVTPPVSTPVAPPIAPPVAPPVTPPVSTPVAPPVSTPVAPPVAPPVAVLAPTATPVSPPVAPSDGLPWVETFSNLANGAQSDVGVTAWSASRQNGEFDVQNGSLLINNGGSVGVFQTEQVSISGFTVDVSVSVRSQGPLETNQDYVRLFVSVDDGPEQLVGEIKGVQSAEAIISGGGFTGNNIRLVVRTFVSFNDEFYFIDNVSVNQAGSAPVPVPVASPVASPVSAPSGCTVPQLLGNSWENVKQYPLSVLEAQGAIIGDDLVIVSGFTDGISSATDETYALNLNDPNAEWRPMDKYPLAQGVTHGALVVLGTKLYTCGGYLGGHPGPHMNDCFVYDHSIAPGTSGQWSTFPQLPEGRAGGGLVYSQARAALIFAGGAERPTAGKATAVDYQHAWMYEFSNPGWVLVDDIPFLSNHMSYVTAFDDLGEERHFFAGGQMGQNEQSGNIDDNYEWDAINEVWIERARMPVTRGHATASTRAISCGYIIAGGSTNESGKTTDISYYDIPSNTWTTVGQLKYELNTPVCDIDFVNGYLYCVSPFGFSNRRRIQV